MPKVIVIHGTKGSPEINWFPWLAAELYKNGIETIVPQMPTPDGQSLTNWIDTFEDQVKEIDQSTIIIGHSIGAVFLLRLLERFSFPIKASVFVSGFTGKIGIAEYDLLNSSFIAGSYNWELIRENAGTILCLAGDNDPYVPFVQASELAKNLCVDQIIVPGGGHLNAEFGYTSFPLLLEQLNNLIIDDAGNELVTLAVFDFAHEAHLLETYLEDQDIPTFIKDKHMVGINVLLTNALGGIKVQVRRCDLEAAKKAYADYQNPSSK